MTNRETDRQTNRQADEIALAYTTFAYVHRAVKTKHQSNNELRLTLAFLKKMVRRHAKYKYVIFHLVA